MITPGTGFNGVQERSRSEKGSKVTDMGSVSSHSQPCAFHLSCCMLQCFYFHFWTQGWVYHHPKNGNTGIMLLWPFSCTLCPAVSVGLHGASHSTVDITTQLHTPHTAPTLCAAESSITQHILITPSHHARLLSTHIAIYDAPTH